jgi:hypothetical protein
MEVVNLRPKIERTPSQNGFRHYARIELSAKGATRPRERAEPTEHIHDVFLVLRSSFARRADAGR